MTHRIITEPSRLLIQGAKDKTFKTQNILTPNLDIISYELIHLKKYIELDDDNNSKVNNLIKFI